MIYFSFLFFAVFYVSLLVSWCMGFFGGVVVVSVCGLSLLFSPEVPTVMIRVPCMYPYELYRFM